jgi:hypothetical protein
MRDPLELRSLARKSRMMTSASLSPGVNRQLWLWASELAEMADEIERGSENRPTDRSILVHFWHDR